MDILTKAFQLKAMGDDGSGTAVIATLGVIDLDGDVTEAGAFGSGQVAKFLPAHDWMSPPLGVATIKEVGTEVRADFQLNLAMPKAQEWHEALKFSLSKGVRQEFSYGFKIRDSGFGEFQGQQVRFLKDLEVLEISPVVQGAGIGTELLSVKDHKSLPFADQIKAVVESVEAVTARAVDIRAKRQADGRDISPDRVKELEAMLRAIGKAAEALDAAVKSEPSLSEQEMERLFSEFETAKMRGEGIVGACT